MNFLKLGEIQLPTIVSITAEEHAHGLMFVKHLPSSMSFLFAETHIANFWMKNTYIPLDFIFVNGTEIVHLASAEPLSEKLVCSKYPCDLVVEMPKGSIDKYSINNSTKINLCLSQATLSKHYKRLLQNVCS